jgi:hypothetical protein
LSLRIGERRGGGGEARKRKRDFGGQKIIGVL